MKLNTSENFNDHPKMISNNQNTTKLNKFHYLHSNKNLQDLKNRNESVTTDFLDFKKPHKTKRNYKITKGVPSCRFLLVLLSINTTAHCLVMSLDASIICNKIVGLVPRQRRICRAYPEAMATVGEGTEMAMQECRSQFAQRRWNCSSSKNEPPLLFMTRIASKESAYVSALRSAGIAYSITKACSLGNLSSCACDRRPYKQPKAPLKRRRAPSALLRRNQRTAKQDWSWGGCSANINYGVNFCRKFLDARENHLDNSKALMNLHNNRAGRKILRENMKTNCRCSGVSGSCSVKTCWYSLPSLKQIGDQLMKNYHRARQVEPMRGQRSLSAVFLKLKRSASNSQKKPHGKELVYLADSPNYCRRNKSLGVLGTRGRQCDRKGKGKESCRHVCCRRGFVSRVVTRRKRCDCSFHWCCYVTCRECMEVVEESFCR